MDKALKKKLEELDPQFDPQHWEKMSERLDQEGLSSLEGAIGAKLDSIAPDVPQDAWTRFEEKRAQAQEEWDDKVREKLSASASSSPDWPLMEAKMEAWLALRRRYITLRTAEVVIILLLLLTFHQYEGLWIPQPMADNTLEMGLSNQLASAINTQENESHGSDNEEETTEGCKETGLKNPEQQIIPGKPTNESDPIIENRQTTRPINQKKSTGQQGVLVVGDQSGSHLGSKLVASVNPEIQRAQSAFRNERDQDLRPQGNTAVIDLMGMNITSLSTYQTTNISSFIKEHIIGHSASYTNNLRWLSVYGFGGINQIRTPSDERFKSRTAYSTSYGTGVELSFQQDRLTWGFGLEYQVTSIHPDRSIRTGDNSIGFITATFEQMDLDFINIPLHIRYNVIDLATEDWYAYAGVRLHMSSSIRYSFDTVLDGPPPPGDFTLKDAKELHNVSETNFTYFTLSTGIGYQRMLNDRWTFFSQAGLDLFGQNSSLFPNGEVIHILRGDIGLRYGL